MKFKAKFKAVSFDWPEYKKVMLNALYNINERAGKAWLHAVVMETPIPVWSGASRATFIKLAQELGTYIPIFPVGDKSNKFDRIAWGRRESWQSGVKKDKGKAYAGIYYRTTLGHLIYNEYNSPVPGPYPQPWSNAVRFTPYFFQQRGEAAWKREAAQAKLPNIARYIKTRAI